MEPVIRPVEGHELETFARTAATGFAHRFDPAGLDAIRERTELARTLAAFDGDALVGTAEAMTSRLSVPGGADLAAAAVKSVVVLPTHRRRGILTRLMDRQLADIAERGEPLAMLWATEASIYDRFGYGMGTHRYSVGIDTAHAALRSAPGSSGKDSSDESGLAATLVEDSHERRAISEAVYETKRGAVPGMMQRVAGFWSRRADDLMGEGAFFVSLADGEGNDRAYASYRIAGGWTENGPVHELSVYDAIALDVAAERALWQFLLNVDLVTKVVAWHRPVDDPLPYLLADPRAVHRMLGDGLWLRIIDLPTALAARRYMCAVDITLAVTDRQLPTNQGTWRLQGDESGATCTPTAEKADLELDTSTLASAFLGHPSLGSPAAAGLVVEHRTGALRQAAAAFCWSPGPWAVTWF